ESGREGVILGLSGGVDSALVAKLCADAIGPGRVLALALPDGKGGRDLKDARKFANAIGIEFRIVNIGPITSAMEKRLKASEADTVARGNLRARARMTVLYYGANTENRVVMGTGNKSEILTGYATKFGDAGADFLPIGDLYKTQVREMAVHLGIPPEIVEKTPTAGLWPGQTDEGELGISYADLVRILLGIELEMEPEAMDSQRHSGPARLLRSGDGLDVGERDHRPEVPSLAEDESRPSHPMLRQEGRDDEEEGVRGDDHSDQPDGEPGRRRTQRDGNSEGGRQARNEEGAADGLGATVREGESLGHGPGTKVSSDKDTVAKIRR